MIYNKKTFFDDNINREDDLLELMRNVDSHRTLFLPENKNFESLPVSARLKMEIKENSMLSLIENHKSLAEVELQDNLIEINDENCQELEKIFEK